MKLAFGKDKFDLSGLIAKWSKDGENVLKVEDLTWSREGLRIELPDGTVEEHSLRGVTAPDGAHQGPVRGGGCWGLRVLH